MTNGKPPITPETRNGADAIKRPVSVTVFEKPDGMEEAQYNLDLCFAFQNLGDRLIAVLPSGLHRATVFYWGQPLEGTNEGT